MSEKNQKLICQDCGREFAFSAGEQKFYQEKGFEPPKRCPDCRKKRKNPSTDKESYQQDDSSFYKITCAECKKVSQIPFRPRSNDPIYCADCFEKKNADKSK